MALLGQSLRRDAQVEQAAFDAIQILADVLMNPVAVEQSITIQARLVEPDRQVVRRETFGLIGERHHVIEQRIRAIALDAGERADHQALARRHDQLAAGVREAELLTEPAAVGLHVFGVVDAAVRVALLKLRELFEHRRQQGALTRQLGDESHIELAYVVDRDCRCAAGDLGQAALVNAEAERLFKVAAPVLKLQKDARLGEGRVARAGVKLVAHGRSHPGFHQRRQVARLHVDQRAARQRPGQPELFGQGPLRLAVGRMP